MGAFDLNSAESAASTGGSLGGPWGAVAGGVLGGFLGSEPTLPRELKNLYRMQYGLADQMRRFSQSVPLSDPGEQAALAQERGLLGQEQNQQTGDLQSQLNLNNALPGQIGDFATNLSNQQTGQRMALDSQHLLNALSTRRQAILQASNIAGNAAAGVKDYQQPPNFSEIFKNIAQLATQNKTLGQANQGDPTNGQAQRDFHMPFAGSTGLNQNILNQGQAAGLSFGGAGQPVNQSPLFGGSPTFGQPKPYFPPQLGAPGQAPSTQFDPRMLFNS